MIDALIGQSTTDNDLPATGNKEQQELGSKNFFHSFELCWVFFSFYFIFLNTICFAFLSIPPNIPP